MSDRPKNANQRRLEQLRAVRDDSLPGPTHEEEIDVLKERIAQLEAEVDRLRQLLQASRPRPEDKTVDRAIESSSPSA